MGTWEQDSSIITLYDSLGNLIYTELTDTLSHPNGTFTNQNHIFDTFNMVITDINNTVVQYNVLSYAEPYLVLYIEMVDPINNPNNNKTRLTYYWRRI